MTIQINGRNYTARLSHVYGYCTSASLRVGSHLIESQNVPYLFNSAALSSLRDAVEARYPGAKVQTGLGDSVVQL